MNKNGLTSRDRERKVGSWVFYVSGFFFISFFVAPMLVGTGEVPPLEARANAFDYATSDGLWSSGNENLEDDFAWTELDP